MKRLALIPFGVFIVLAAISAPTTGAHTSTPTPSKTLVGETGIVVWVFDGDTIAVHMDSTIHRVRYIGINAPETDEVCGSEATAVNVSLVRGRTVTMFKDASEIDRYGRLLRYVYVGDTFVNAELVVRGYAEAVAYPPDTAYADYFERLEATARAAGLGCHPAGVFGTGDDEESPAITLTTNRVVSVRSGPGVSYPIVDHLPAGEAVEVQGHAGRRVWLLIGPERWVPAWAVSVEGDMSALPVYETLPASTPTPTGQAPLMATRRPISRWNCSGNRYNCSDFSSCAEVMDYWRACPGDPSHLDGDNDGKPCESLCRG
jgi:endonuclease YncB( thermonuclease family)